MVARIMLIFALIFMLFGCSNSSKDKDKTSNVQGSVVDALTGTLLSGVIVKMANKSNETDKNGKFLITGVPMDGLDIAIKILTASKDGYKDYNLGIKIEKDATVTHNIKLIQLSESKWDSLVWNEGKWK